MPVTGTGNRARMVMTGRRSPCPPVASLSSLAALPAPASWGYQRLRIGGIWAAPLKPLPKPVNLDQYRIRRRARIGGLINEYHLVA